MEGIVKALYYEFNYLIPLWTLLLRVYMLQHKSRNFWNAPLYPSHAPKNARNAQQSLDNTSPEKNSLQLPSSLLRIFKR